MSEPVWWCPECEATKFIPGAHLQAKDSSFYYMNCPGTPIDLIAERERFFGWLREYLATPGLPDNLPPLPPEWIEEAINE